jgi:hypothetical protein
MDSEEAYRRIFEKKSFSSFLRDPSSLLPNMTENGMGKDEVSAVGSLISASKDLFVDSISNQDSVKAQRSLASLSESSGMGYKEACRIVSDIRAAIGLSPVSIMGTGQSSIEPVMKYVSLGDETLEQNGILFKESSYYRGSLSVVGYTGRSSQLDVPASINHEGNWLKVMEIGKGALIENPYVRTVNLPQTVLTIDDEAFMWGQVESISMPGIKRIGSCAFMSCPLRAIDLTGVNFVLYNTFSNCDRLRSIVIPEGVRMIREGAFMGCTALESVSFPSTLTVLEGSSFAECTSLRSVKLPDSLLVVGFDSFRDCSRLSSVTFGNSTRDIEAGAFEGCSLLRSVVIPESVTKIEDGAFPRSTKIIREGEAPKKTGFFKKLIGNRIRNRMNVAVLLNLG